MKTIKASQVTQVKVEDLRPGHLTLEGLVLFTELDTLYTTVAGTFSVDKGDTVPVFAVVDDEVLSITREAFEERKRR